MADSARVSFQAEPGNSAICRLVVKFHNTILPAPVSAAITLPSWEMATLPIGPELVCSLTDSSGWQSCHR